jgi:hypothetical protein
MGFGVKRYVAAVLNTLLLLDHLSSSKTNLILDPIPAISNRRVAILAIYYSERCNDLARYIEELEELDFAVVPVLNISEANFVHQKLAPFVFYRRKNLGFDLAIFRDALDSIAFSRSIEIILINDSMNYKPGSLKNLVEISRRSPQNTLTSMLESFQRKRHLQTFFMYGSFDQSGFNSLCLAFSQIRNWRYKRSVVVFGEKRLHQLIEKTTLKCNGIWNTDSLKELIDRDCEECSRLLQVSSNNINPTNHLIHLTHKYRVYTTKF